MSQSSQQSALVLANNNGNGNGNTDPNSTNTNSNTNNPILTLTSTTTTTTTTTSNSNSNSNTKPSQQLNDQQRKKKEQAEREKKLQLQKQGATKPKVDPKGKAPQKPTTTLNGDINLLKKESEFLCSLQFRNTLPDIPFEPKLLSLPLDPSRFVKFSAHNTLERVCKQHIWPDLDLGIPISLIDPTLYKTPTEPIPIPPEDAELIKMGADLASGKSQRRMENIRPQVSWLKKTTYLSTEDDGIKFGRPQKQDNVATNAREEDNKTLDEKIDIINKSFELASNIPTRHPLLKPDVKLVSVFPIIPDIDLYSTEYAEIIFDSDPLDINPEQDNEFNKYKRSCALFKPIGDTSYCDYFVHSVSQAPAKMDRGMEDGDQYEQVRSFKADVVDNTEVKDNYFFVERNGALHYNPLKIRVRARKMKFESEEFLDRPNKLKLVKVDMRPEDELKRKQRADIIVHEEDGW